MTRKYRVNISLTDVEEGQIHFRHALDYSQELEARKLVDELLLIAKKFDGKEV